MRGGIKTPDFQMPAILCDKVKGAIILVSNCTQYVEGDLKKLQILEQGPSQHYFLWPKG